MNIHTRRNLFYLFCLAFLILGTGTVLFAQGWRLDLGTWRINKIGGIFIRSSPRDASITIDTIPVKNNSWLLQNGTFINNLFPKTYFLTLEKPGFHTWKLHVSVAPSLVSEISYAVLVPSEPTILPTSTLPRISATSSSSEISTSSQWIAKSIATNTSFTLLISQRVSASSTDTTSTLPSLLFNFRSPLAILQWNDQGVLGILEQNGTLWRIDPNTSEKQKIGDDVIRFSWNKDGNKIAAIEYNSLEIFDLQNPREGYRRFNIPGIGTAKEALWYWDNMHLFLVFPSSTKFLDVNDANLENLVEVTPTDTVVYDPDTNILYARLPKTTTTAAFQFPK